MRGTYSHLLTALLHSPGKDGLWAPAYVPGRGHYHSGHYDLVCPITAELRALSAGGRAGLSQISYRNGSAKHLLRLSSLTVFGSHYRIAEAPKLVFRATASPLGLLEGRAPHSLRAREGLLSMEMRQGWSSGPLGKAATLAGGHGVPSSQLSHLHPGGERQAASPTGSVSLGNLD